MNRFCFFFLICSSVLFAQTDENYVSVVDSIVQSYNTDNAQQLYDLFTEELQQTMPLEKVKETFATLKKAQGNFSEYDFMDNDGGRRYLIQSDNDSVIISIKVSAELKLIQFVLE